MMKKPHTQLRLLGDEIDALSAKIADLQRELALKRQDLEKLKKAIAIKKKKTDVKLSEHALLRYYERVYGHDPLDAEKEILTRDLIDFVGRFGDCTFHFKKFKAVVKNNIVVTII